MTDLVLGVIEVAYDTGGEAKKPRKAKHARSSEPTTTVLVATVLEAKYGVMATFADAHQNDITGDLISSIEGALEDLYAGAPMRDPFAEGCKKIDGRFRQFLMTAEIESMGIPGVPTKAAVERRSLRFKKKKSDHDRPSMVDTGLYSASAISWVEPT